MIPCPDQKQRAEANADGFTCINAAAAGEYKHGGKPSAGTCARCTIRPQPVSDAQLIAIASRPKISLDVIGQRIAANMPKCNACEHFDGIANDGLPRVHCDKSPKKCRCVNIGIEACPIGTFTNA